MTLPIEPRFELVLDFGREPVLVRGPERWVRWLCDQYGGTWSGEPPSPSVVIESREPGALPDRAPDDRDGDGYDVWWNDRELHVQRRGFRAWMSRGEPGRVLVGRSGSEVDRNMLRYSQYGMSWCLAAPDRLVLHCAAVGLGDRVVLLVGRSGAGKSTAVLAGLSAGLDVLADDLVVVRGAESPVVTGVARNVVAPMDMIEAAGMVGRVLKEARSERRRRAYLPRSVLRSDSLELAGTVLVEHDEGDGSLDRIEAGERAAAMVHGFAIPAFVPVVRTHLAMMARTGALPMWRLGHAHDPRHRLEHAARSLEAVLQM